MDIEQYNYNLPEHLIAQTPLENRTNSKLLVLNQDTNEIKHEQFHQLANYLQAGDCLVINDSKVIPVRLFGEKTDTKAKIEILLLHETETDVWEALVKPARKVKIGAEINFGNKIKAKCIAEKKDGGRLLQLQYEGIFLEVLNELGEMPLPPYIKEKLTEQDRYQTVYAKSEGSAAAPTAGLHFTDKLLAELTAKDIKIIPVTLHVGLGTFRPVSVENIKDHEMHAEYYTLSKKSADQLNKTRSAGGKIIAVGTTSTRVLETVINKYDGIFAADTGWTNIFIYPPYEYKGIDGLITNFHLPKSTLLLLISALVSREQILKTYETAIKHEYRFFSFGDAMFILPKKE